MSVTDTISDVTSSLPFSDANKNKIEQIRVRDVINSVTESNTLNDLLKKTGIGENAETLISNEIGSLLQSEASGNTKIAKLLLKD